MTTQETRKRKLKPGYVWCNVAPIDEKPDWQEKVATQPDSDKLFGYDKDEFLAKQYK